MIGHRFSLLASIAILFAAAVRADDAPQRQPVPHAGKQAIALRQIREQYRSDYAQNPAADRLALSKKFQQLAKASSEDPVRKYVLLRESRELAVDAGDFDQAFAVIDETAKGFAISGDELKVSALTAAIDKAAIPKPELMENYLRVARTALEDADVRMAMQASLLATRVARELRDPALEAQAKEVNLQVHAARRQLQSVLAAANKLRAHPDDPEANLLVGRYLCFAQGRWADGMSLLAKGSDKKLADLAQRDLADPSDPTGRVALGDAWWEIPDTAQTPQKRSRQRAVYWYRQALPKLAANQKPRVEARIAQVPPARGTGASPVQSDAH